MKVLPNKDKGLNNHFKVVFTPKNPELFGGRRRFCVGIYSLHKYIGVKNATNVIVYAFKSENQTPSVRLRKWGLVQFYAK